MEYIGKIFHTYFCTIDTDSGIISCCRSKYIIKVCIHKQFFMVRVAEIDPWQKPQDKLLIFFSAPSPPRTLGHGIQDNLLCSMPRCR